ncbi:MAG: OmpA family protein [Planctomycetota bacterium]
MSTKTRTLALAALFTMAACVSPEEHRRALGANQALKAEIASLTAAQHAISLENERLRSEMDRLGKQAADADWIREQKDKLDKLLSQYQSGGAGAVDGVELVRTSEGLAFRVLGGVLFSPGSIQISEQGKQTLGKLISTLKQEGKRVRIDGHTDDTPIKNSRWGTNLRLSAERALAVAEFLTQSGFAADQVGVAGYGEHRPTTAGSTEDSRQQNRRVEILMLDR